MLLHSSQPAEESLPNEETFLALEVEVLDDFTSSRVWGQSGQLRNEHLQYLAALHIRGEDMLGLQLLDRALGEAEDIDLSAENTKLFAEIFLLQAQMLLASNSSEEAEAALYRAAKTSTNPELSGKIALRHAKLLSGQSKVTEALKVLQEASDTMPQDLRPTELVIKLAAMYAHTGDYNHAVDLLEGHNRHLSEASTPRRTAEAALCRLQLVSLLLAQGKPDESINALRIAAASQATVPQPLIELTHYYSAVCTAIATGKLLPESLGRTSFLSQRNSQDDTSLSLFATFEWIHSIRASDNAALVSPKRVMTLDPDYLAEVFHAEELRLQGSAYGRLSEHDYDGAIKCFHKLDRWRDENGRRGTLIAALDSRALAFALGRAGRSAALVATRFARRRLQLILGLSSVTTLEAIRAEAQILLDYKETAQAGVLVRPAISRGMLLDDRAREVLLRLRLVLMEVNTRAGNVQDSFNELESLSSEARALTSTAPDLEPILQYQTAAAMAFTGSFDEAEHLFSALCRALADSAEEINHELAPKATYGLARVMQHRGEYGHALSLFRSLTDTGASISRPLSLRVRRRIGECLTRLDDHAAAAEVYRSCADDLAKWAGVKDTNYIDMRLTEADCLLAAGHYKLARRHYRAMWEVLHKEHSGREVFYIRAVMGNGTCLRRLKDYSGAVFNYRRVHRFETKHQHMSKDQLLDLEKWLAWSLEMAGFRQEAAQHYAEAIRLLEELHPERLSILDDLKFRFLCCDGMTYGRR